MTLIVYVETVMMMMTIMMATKMIARMEAFIKALELII
jgi:hypothetical protein